jgi:uncharacterized coiled-coil protein SlyX
VRLLDGIDRCVNVRWADPASLDSDRYRIDFRHLGDVTVHRVVDGQSTPIASAPVSSEMDVWNRIGVEVSRDRIRVFIDGTQVLEATDSFVPHGAIALEGHPGSVGANELGFDNVHVVRIPELESADDRIEELERLVGEQTVLLEELRNQTHDQEEAIANLEESIRGLVVKGRSVLRCLRQAGIPCDPDEGR